MEPGGLPAAQCQPSMGMGGLKGARRCALRGTKRVWVQMKVRGAPGREEPLQNGSLWRKDQKPTGQTKKGAMKTEAIGSMRSCDTRGPPGQHGGMQRGAAPKKGSLGLVLPKRSCAKHPPVLPAMRQNPAARGGSGRPGGFGPDAAGWDWNRSICDGWKMQPQSWTRSPHPYSLPCAAVALQATNVSTWDAPKCCTPSRVCFAMQHRLHVTSCCSSSTSPDPAATTSTTTPWVLWGDPRCSEEQTQQHTLGNAHRAPTILPTSQRPRAAALLLPQIHNLGTLSKADTAWHGAIDKACVLLAARE